MELNINGSRYSAFSKAYDTSATCVQETEHNRLKLQVRWEDKGLRVSGYCEAYNPEEAIPTGSTVRYQSIPLAVRRELKKAVRERANESE